MPQYPCTRCGVAVNVAPSFAPVEIICPACRGEKATDAREGPGVPWPIATPVAATPASVGPPPMPGGPAAFPGEAAPYLPPAARLEPRQQETKRSRPWWPGLIISHGIAVLGVVVLAITENAQEAQPKGPAWVAALSVAMLLIVDVISALPALIGAAILLAFNKSFGRWFVFIFSVVVALFSVLLLIGALVPEEWVEEDEPALPNVPLGVE